MSICRPIIFDILETFAYRYAAAGCRKVLESQVDAARVELVELLKEVEMRRGRGQGSAANTPDPAKLVDRLRSENRLLAEENDRLLHADSEQLAVACDELNSLQASLHAARDRAVRAEATVKELADKLKTQAKAGQGQGHGCAGEADRLAATISGLESENAEMKQRLARFEELEARHREDIRERELKLEAFAADTANLQSKMQEVLGVAQGNNTAEMPNASRCWLA
ncbi:hypothetical protein DIPPA_33720 [Diplonema papillatum]|nr:hypothetical protein DIPPA_33720 [Diplonema papillatum]